MTRKSAGNMNAATSAQQLIHGKFAHQADHSDQSRDKEFADFITHHITHMPRIDKSRNKDFADLLTGHTKRKTKIDDRPFETKEFVGLLTGHITQKRRNDNGSIGYMQYADMLTGYSTHNRAKVELHTLQETFESTGAGTTLDISMLGNNNHTPISSGIVNLTTTFSNQLNMENKDEEGTILNIVDGMNLYQQVYYPWTGHTLAEAS
ncbi:hypothetical protein HAX54_048040 [Datura stramonium]|uniref:Uncharacterized protein n=1 Tax=Datura stramonium TaxID=4076 RepID=A0ABS8STJ7_DATST|nr:hypothetical protein [Datura stramonium]